MRFSVDVNVVKQPEMYDMYMKAFMDQRHLENGSKVVAAVYHSEDGTTYCEFKVRS